MMVTDPLELFDENWNGLIFHRKWQGRCLARPGFAEKPAGFASNFQREIRSDGCFPRIEFPRPAGTGARQAAPHVSAHDFKPAAPAPASPV
ncbi:MAG: hypothetical protein ACLFRG_14405 [Desulfococcaceae bacterium]